MEWYTAVLKKYAEFSGRARRKEYWMFVLLNLIIGFAIGFVGGLIHLGVLSMLYSLAVLLPSVAVGVRRLHDTGRSGWWMLVALIPLVGWLVLLYFMVQEGQPGDNQYGPNPKAIEAHAAPAM